MPELSDFVAPQANPMAQFNQGLQSGADWAIQKAHVDNQSAQVQNQIAQTQQMRDEFQFKVGNQMTDDYAKILPLENGPYKNQLLQSFQDKYEQAGHPVHDSWVAGAKDPVYNQGISDILADMKDTGIKDPDLFKKVMRNVPQGFGQELMQDALKKNWEMAKTMSLMNARNEATDKRQDKRLNQSLQITGQKDYANIQKGVDFSLNGSSRVLSIIDKIEDPNTPKAQKIIANGQVRTILGNEAARLVTQKANFGEGTAGGMAIDTYAARANDLYSKIKDSPQDSISPDYLRQEKALYLDLTKEYMAAHDRAVNTATPDVTPGPERTQILGRAQRYQEQMGKRFQKYGGWQGGGIQGIPKPGSSSGPDDNASSATPKKADDGSNNRKAALGVQRLKDLSPDLRSTAIERMKSEFGEDAVNKALGAGNK